MSNFPPFTTPVFQWFVPAYSGGMVPAAGYKAKFYDVGTDTPKTVYTNSDLSTPYPSPSNEVTLNDEGEAVIYLGAGGYKLVITEPNDTPINTFDDLFSTGASIGVSTADSFDALKVVSTSMNSFCFIGGYYAKGDGGHGMFYNAVSGTSADGGYIQDSTFAPAKKWFRISDEDGDVRAASFGYIPTRASLPDPDTHNTRLQAADSYCKTNNKRLVIDAGSSSSLESITLQAPFVRLNPGWQISGTGSEPQLTFEGIAEGLSGGIFNGIKVTFSDYQVNDSPQSFGASPTALPAINDAAFQDWINAGGGMFTLPVGIWPVTDANAFPFIAKLFNLLGVLSGAGTVGPGIRNPDGAFIRVHGVLFDNGTSIASSGSYASLASTDFSIGRDLSVARNSVIFNDSSALRNAAVVGDLCLGADALASTYKFYQYLTGIKTNTDLFGGGDADFSNGAGKFKSMAVSEDLDVTGNFNAANMEFNWTSYNTFSLSIAGGTVTTTSGVKLMKYAIFGKRIYIAFKAVFVLSEYLGGPITGPMYMSLPNVFVLQNGAGNTPFVYDSGLGNINSLVTFNGTSNSMGYCWAYNTFTIGMHRMDETWAASGLKQTIAGIFIGEIS